MTENWGLTNPANHDILGVAKYEVHPPMVRPGAFIVSNLTTTYIDDAALLVVQREAALSPKAPDHLGGCTETVTTWPLFDFGKVMNRQQALPGFPKTKYREKMIRSGKPLYANRKNLKGKRFGRLVALRDVGKSKNGKRLWECKCDCGNITIVRTSQLTCGTTKSCGCLSKEKGICIVKEDSNLNIVLTTYKQGAMQRGYKWSLTDEEAIKLFQGNCVYCGQAPSNVKEDAKGLPFIWNGIDRKDSGGDYTLENCVSCCSECNYLKRDRMPSEFLELIMKIAEYQLSKK